MNNQAKTIKIATELSEIGKRQLLKVLSEELKPEYLNTILEGWLSDVRYAEHDSREAKIEIGGFYTKSGNPRVETFRGDEVVLTEEEIDE